MPVNLQAILSIDKEKIMSVSLNSLSDARVNKKNRKRIGRGIGSGTGKTAGKGHKGQKARSGVAVNGFEGGQMPIHRRLPKRGFNNYTRTHWQIVNLSKLQEFIDAKKIDASKKITKQVLLDANILNKPALPVKLLAKGEIKAKLDLELDGASIAAIKLVEKAGGKVTVLRQEQTKEQAA